jgi:hypothetical protein
VIEARRMKDANERRRIAQLWPHKWVHLHAWRFNTPGIFVRLALLGGVLLPGHGVAQASALEGAAPLAAGGINESTLVIAGLAALALVAGLAAGVLLLVSRRRQRKSPGGFSLQVSVEVLELSPGKSASFQALVWQAGANGSRSIAPEASVSMHISGHNPAGVRLRQSTTGNTVTCVVSAPQGSRGGTVTVEVSARAGGNRLQAAVQVSVSSPVKLGAWVKGKTQAEVLYNPILKTWDFPEIVIYFYAPDDENQAIQPPFKVRLLDIPPAVEPAALVTVEYLPHEGGCYTLCMHPEGRLEDWMGQDLENNDGMIQVTVFARDETQRLYSAQVSYHLAPQAQACFYWWDGDPAQPPSGSYREVKGVRLAPGELLADGFDEIHFGIFLAYSHWMDDFGQAFERRLELDPGTQIAPGGKQMADFVLETQLPGPRDVVLGKMYSSKPLLYQQTALDLQLRASLQAKAGRYANLRTISTSVEQAIQPYAIYLKLWVIPGKQAGTSQAYAFLDVPGKADALCGQALMLDVLATGDGELRIQPGGATTEAGISDPAGLASWELAYRGIDWANFNQACFEVRCGLPGRSGQVTEGVCVAVHVGNNVTRLLADLYAARLLPELDVDNRSMSGEVSLAGEAENGYSLPEYLKGPLVNIRASGGSAKTERYTCEKLTERIYSWLCLRRLGQNRPKGKQAALCCDDPEQMACMNGLEIGCYDCLFLQDSSRAFSQGGELTHNFAGIFLSSAGLSHMRSPLTARFIDPWWRQNWAWEGYKVAENLYSSASQIRVMQRTWTAATLLAATSSMNGSLLWGLLTAAPAYPLEQVARRGVNYRDPGGEVEDGMYLRQCGAQVIEEAVRRLHSPGVRPPVEGGVAW